MMATGTSAGSCLRSIKKARLSSRNEPFLDTLLFSLHQYGPLSHSRRQVHATRRTLPLSRNPPSSGMSTTVVVGKNSALRRRQGLTDRARRSPINLRSARGFLTTSVSRSEAIAAESSQHPLHTFESMRSAVASSSLDASIHWEQREREELKILSFLQQAKRCGLQSNYSASSGTGITCHTTLWIKDIGATFSVEASDPGARRAQEKCALMLISNLKRSDIWRCLLQIHSSHASEDWRLLMADKAKHACASSSLDVPVSSVEVYHQGLLKIFFKMWDMDLFDLDIETSESFTCTMSMSMADRKEVVEAVVSAPDKEQAQTEACLLLISRLQKANIWKDLLLATLNPPHAQLAVNDDLFCNIQWAHDALKEGKDRVKRTMSKHIGQPRQPRWRFFLRRDYRQKRSDTLLKELSSFRQSKDPRILALRSATAKLPVNDLQKPILDLIRNHTYSLIVAETGSGKSTQVPQIILNDSIDRKRGGYCSVLCVQPRRIAAQMVARRVADERHEELSSRNSVGYKVRFDYHTPSPSGSITYCTTGIMLNMLQSKTTNELEKYSHIILDEVHVRDIGIDFVMLLLKRYIDRCPALRRPTPKVIVMSATIDIDLFSSYFRNEKPDGTLLPAPHISVPGRQFHVKRHYLNEVLKDVKTSIQPDILSKLLGERATQKFLQEHSALSGTETRELIANILAERSSKEIFSPRQICGNPDDEAQLMPLGLICAAIFHLLTTTKTGSVLVFLPGLRHLFGLEQQLRSFGSALKLNLADEGQFRVLKLHSDLPDELAKLSLPFSDSCRRIILATDIAEASLTIADVKYVIDSGKVYQKTYDSETHSRRMACSWVSQSSALQRLGRAGRVQNGEYFFLGAKEHFDSLRITKSPEIIRSDLQETCLLAKSVDPDIPISEFLSQAIEPPDDGEMCAAIESLKRMKALENPETLTNLGQALASLKVTPALGKLVILGIIFRCLDPLLILGAMGDDTDLFRRGITLKERVEILTDRAAFIGLSASDHISRINAFKAVRQVWSKDGPLGASEYTLSSNIDIIDYREIFVNACQVLTRLARARLITQAQAKFRDDGEFGGPSLNVNSQNIPLIKALLLHCLSPQLAAPRGQTAYSTQIDRSVKLWPFSVIMSKPPPRSLIVYSTKYQHPEGMMLMDASLISPLTACLFGGELTWQRDLLVVNHWLRIKLSVKEASYTTNTYALGLVSLGRTLDKALATAIDSFLSSEHFSSDKDRAEFNQARSALVETLQQTANDLLLRDLDRITPADEPVFWDSPARPIHRKGV